jgi:hypothetical protein
MFSCFLWGATCLEGTELRFQFSNTRFCIPSQSSFLTGTLLGLEAGLLGLETGLLGLQTAMFGLEAGLFGFTMGQKFLPCLCRIKV